MGAMRRERPAGRGSGRSLAVRVFLANAVVLTAAVVALLATPVTVSSPTSEREAGILLAGLLALLLVNVFAIRRALAPLVRLEGSMRDVDVVEPGGRLEIDSRDREVASLASSFNEMLDRLERERRVAVTRSVRAQEDERRRVAQELHDEVGQNLTTVLLHLERLEEVPPEQARAELAEAREATRIGLEDVRSVAARLRPEALDDLGLPNALAALCARMSDRSGLTIERDLGAAPEGLAADEELAVYRIAQEALTNVLRHARARRAELRLAAAGGDVVLSVADDGTGAAGAESGAGIQGMRERALSVGGALVIERSALGGTEVRFVFTSTAEA